MKSDLDLLIELYETEKLSLESSIKENIDEHEYLSIYHYGEALLKVNSKLYLLNCFKYPFYKQEEQLRRLMDLETKVETYGRSFWKEMIANEKEEIQKLKDQNEGYFNDSQVLDDALFNLHEGKYSKFKFHFSHRGEPFYLEFEIGKEKTLNIIVETKKILNQNDPDDLETNQVHLFKNLGFKPNDQGDLLIYKYNMKIFRDALIVKELLARIIYDIGYVGDDKEATLEYL